MKNFIEEIKKYDDFVSLGGTDEKEIQNAEEILGLRFDTEYRDFILKCGSASANGHEFLGICNSKRLNIVEETLKEKKKNEKIPEDMYLIETVGIDRLLTWQNSKGELFQTFGKSEPLKLDIDLLVYVDK